MLDLLRLRLRAAARAAAAVGRTEPVWAVVLVALLGIAAAFAWTLPRSPIGSIRLGAAQRRRGTTSSSRRWGRRGSFAPKSDARWRRGPSW